MEFVRWIGTLLDGHGRHKTKLSRGRRFVNTCCILVIAGCTCNGGQVGGIVPPNGLELENASGAFRLLAATNGQTFSMPVSVRRIDDEMDGESVTITPFGPPGCTFDPPTRTVDLPAANAKLYTSFDVRVGDRTALGIQEFGARRTSTEPLHSERFVDNAELNIIANLVRVSITPTDAEVLAGTSAEFTLSILPLGNTQGPVELTMRDSPTNGGVSLSPTVVTANLTKGSTVPVVKKVIVTAGPNAQVQTHRLSASVNSTFEVGALAYKVINPSATPSFTITANPTSVATANQTLSADSVEFTLTSVNGFSGNVTVNYSSPQNSIEPSPSTNGFTVAVIPGNPGKFTRKFWRYVNPHKPGSDHLYGSKCERDRLQVGGGDDQSPSLG